MKTGALREPVPDRWTVYQGTPPRGTQCVAGEGWWSAPEDTLLKQSAPPLGKAFMPSWFLTHAPSLVITDVDSTLIDEEVIDELADQAGVKADVAAITARAMNGEIEFERSLRDRVALLRGLPEQSLTQVSESITLTAGAPKLIEWAHRVGASFAVVSGGFTRVIDPLVTGLGIDHLLANRLEIKDGVLTGRTMGPIVTPALKVAAMLEWSRNKPEQVLAIGDGANDVPMLEKAGVGIAFCAKPAVRQQVGNYLDLRRLDAVTGLLGWNG